MRTVNTSDYCTELELAIRETLRTDRDTFKAIRLALEHGDSRQAHAIVNCAIAASETALDKLCPP